MTHVLIAESVPRIASFIRKGLRSDGYLTTTTDNGESVMDLARTGMFDLLIIDAHLPDRPGTEALRLLRAEGITIPAMILTTATKLQQTFAELDGATDEVVTMPFNLDDLLARVWMRIAPTDAEDEEINRYLDAGGLRLDLRTRRVTADGLEADLTGRECALLEVLMTNAGQVLSRTQIRHSVWGYAHSSRSNIVEVFIRSLRMKIGEDRIETVRRFGYRFRAPSPALTTR